MARLKSSSEVFRVAMQATLDQTRKVLIATARREHERVMTTDPKPSSSYRIVDGVRDAPLEGVRADGVVVYRFPRIEEVVRFAMETLFDLSPVDKDLYRRSHAIFLNGREVANLADYKPGDDVAITNTVPYSRKIEVGSMKMRVPATDQVFQRARRKVMARWGNVAEVQFTYRGIAGSGRSGAKPGRETRGGSREPRFPVLLIRER